MPWSVKRVASAGRRRLGNARHSLGHAGSRRSDTPGETDEAFVERVYQEVLGRPVDPPGRAHALSSLKAGTPRAQIVAALEASDEYSARVEAQLVSTLPDLRESAAERYAVDRSIDGEDVPIYLAPDAAAFDWIDGQIAEHRYYEQRGIWSLDIDFDKQVMSELISLLQPSATIEVGCSSGSVMQGLVDRDVDAHGIDISEYAKERAGPDVRDRIHLGDVRTLQLDARFDVGYGLDIFEHVSPNILDEFIEAFRTFLAPGGLVLANIPAFGDDPVFGEVFPTFLPRWQADAARGEMFSALQVDSRGFPLHGHLIWATTDWWVERFTARGFERRPAIEAELHRVYDWYFEQASPARKSFYVFANGDATAKEASILASLRGYESAVLEPVRVVWAEHGLT